MTHYKLLSRLDTLTVDVQGVAPELTVRVEGVTYRVGFRSFTGTGITMEVDDLAYEVEILDEAAAKLRLRISGEEFEFVRASGGRPQAQARARAATLDIESTLPGKVVAVLVKEGDAVNPGDPLVLIDSMKMETAMRTEAGGRVLTVHVKKGEPVQKRQLLVRITATPSA